MTRDTVLLDLVQGLGELRAQNNLILQEQGRAADGRKEMSEKVEALNIKIVELVGEASRQGETIDGMKPIVKDYERSKYKALGILMTIAGFTSGVGFFANEIRAWLLGRH